MDSLARAPEGLGRRVPMMLRQRAIDLAAVSMPLFFFPLSFIVLRERFIVSMAISTIIMGSVSLAIMLGRGDLRKIMVRGGIYIALILSMLATSALYAIFIAGGYISTLMGLWPYVDMVYRSIEISIGAYKDLLPLYLAVIGTMEEIFWRGYIQSHIVGKILGLKGTKTVLISSLYYTLVHAPTHNPPLIAGALFVGIVTGLVAARQGVLSSIIAHIVWLELIVIYAPAPSVLSRIGVT